ncbi:hypothetical protein EI94DRAFT_868967 [Lactarius quietus]|nr:hypothetical protein EI94DRAFT_868967 [Lactarius quietus]
MQIRCTPGACIENTPNHLPSMPLHVEYVYGSQLMTKQDELGLYQALQLHDRLFHISLHLPPSILHKCFVLMDKHFPILKCLCLRVLSTADDITTFALPKAFLAPNLRYLALPGISTPRRLRVLTSTVSLVTLVLTNIQTSGYFRPRILVARLWFLPRLEDLSISFSVHIPHPIAERELFQGVDTYLECLLAQIRTPLLERLQITLFYQRAFALPHLSYLINITEVFKLHQAIVYFGRDEVSIATYHHNLRWSDGPFSLSVGCKRLNWQVDCAAQIFSGFISVLSSVEKLTFYLYNKTPSAEWGNGEIDRTKWHDLLRSFTGVKQIRFCDGLSKELSPALQFNEVVGSDPRFLPNLQNILAPYNMFTSFINARQVSGRPVQFYHW